MIDLLQLQLEARDMLEHSTIKIVRQWYMQKLFHAGFTCNDAYTSWANVLASK